MPANRYFPSWASNFYESDVNYGGLPYGSVEAAYQAQKARTHHVRQTLFSLLAPKPPTPSQAKRLGRAVVIRGDWEQIKDQVMLALLRLKFDKITHPYLCAQLMNHSDRLVEWNTWHDNYWGVCTCERKGCNGGLNRLGDLLMQVRRELNGMFLHPELLACDIPSQTVKP